MAQTTQDFADLLFQHQAQLTEWCTRLSGDATSAEDLAQETIIEAWRIRHKLTDVSGLKPWLYSIARFICLRWRRKAGHAHHLLEDERVVADDFDLEAEFEQEELAALVDKALTWLPIETRAMMAAYYLEGQSAQILAADLGITENALAVRLHRGKQALHQTLKTHLRTEAQAYGLLASSDDWQSTRLWCYVCGQRHLQTRFDTVQGNFTLYCDGCGFALEEATRVGKIIGEVQGVKRVVNRLATWSSRRFVAAGQEMTCFYCGQPNIIRISPCETHRGHEIEMDGSCSHCGSWQRESLYGQAIHHPEGQRFWRTQERIRIVPHRLLEIDGQTVVQTTLQSVRHASQLHVFSAYHDGRVLRVETVG